MWPRWGKSGRRRNTSNSSSTSFSYRTFKDVLNLCEEEEQEAKQQHQQQRQIHHRKISVIHRIDSNNPLGISASVAKTLLRSCTSLPVPDQKKTLDGDLDSTVAFAPTADPPPPDSSSSTTKSIQTPPPPPIINVNDGSIALRLRGGAEKRIVVYFTSLRVVRKTFEDCRSVWLILKGFRVSVDERDLSMDSGFLEELEGILGERVSLPRIFIGGRYIGGADEIRYLHETGDLKKYIQGFPPACVCDSCGGYRFILCNNCNGSHKCFVEEEGEKRGGFRCCTKCNENGLIRCPDCCFPVFSCNNEDPKDF